MLFRSTQHNNLLEKKKKKKRKNTPNKNTDYLIKLGFEKKNTLSKNERTEKERERERESLMQIQRVLK